MLMLDYHLFHIINSLIDYVILIKKVILQFQIPIQNYLMHMFYVRK
jgi:hypothetical protein